MKNVRQPSAARPRRRRPAFDSLERRALLAAPGLTISLNPSSVTGNSGAGAATGTVGRFGTDNALPLTVSLASSNPGSVAVPASVVIPAGQASTTFGVAAPAGGTPVGNSTVKLTAAATAEASLARDATFTSSSPSFSADAVAIQPDGKVVAVGYQPTGNPQNYYQLAVTRTNANGTADSTFNNGSPTLVGTAGQSWLAEAVAVRPSDGEIFVAGRYQLAGSSQFTMILARFNPAGGLDGVQTITQIDDVDTVAVQPDGKILLGGDTHDNGPTYADFAVMRLNADGTADPTFGNGKFAVAAVGKGDAGYGLALQPDGRIIVAGTTFGGNSAAHFAAARFTAAGQLDATFGAGGTVETDLPGYYERADSVTLQADGKIVLAGSVSPNINSPGGTDVALVRYTAAGALDPTFGSNGVASQDFGGVDTADAVLAEPDGTILVSGTGAASGRGLFARFLPNGALDGSTSPSGAYDLKAMAPESNGRVVVAGAALSSNTIYPGLIDAFAGTAALTASATVSVYTSPNPRATDDSYGVTKSTPLVVAAPGVLANDTDAPGQTLTALFLGGASHGSVRLNADGSFTYTPDEAYLGPDKFAYAAVDGGYFSNTAFVNLTVTGPDDPPVSGDDSYTIRDTGASGTLAEDMYGGVLRNDSDPNGQAITAVLVAPPRGTLTLKPDGSFSYTSPTGFFGTDSFTYQAYDGQLLGNVATVSIQVQPVPSAVPESYKVTENGTLVVAAPGVLGNDTDPAGLTLTPVVTSAPAAGTLALNNDGSFTYTPNQGTYGADAFTYYVTDGINASAPVTDAINVAQLNPPPTAEDDAYTLDEDTTLATAPPVTEVTMTSQPGDPIGQGRSYDFTPAAATITTSVVKSDASTSAVAVHVAAGADSFDYDFLVPGQTQIMPGTYTGAVRYPPQGAAAPGLDVAGDGRDSTTLTGQFTVYQALYDITGRNLIAFAADFEQHSDGAAPALTGRILYHSSFTSPQGVLFNDTDPSNDPLTARLVAAPTHGTVALNADGTFRYTPASGYVGTDQFTYVPNNGTYDGNVATVALTVSQTKFVDAGFEAVPVGTGSRAYAYNAAGSAWAFAGNAGLAGNGSDFTAGNPAAPDGTQVAFLQASGSIYQTLFSAGTGSYQLVFKAAQRQNYPSNQAIKVMVGGIYYGTITPTGTAYSTYVVPIFGLTVGKHTVVLQGTSSSIYDTAFVDSVGLVEVPTAHGPTIGDASFEAVAQGSGSTAYTYNPAGSPWTFAGNAGLSGNNSNFTAGNPAAPQDNQVAFLQASGSITQTIANWFPGTYALSLVAAQRQNFASNQSIQVLLDGALVATIRPRGTTYATYTTPGFAVAAGNHTLTIRGTSSSIYDTAFVDGLRLDPAPAVLAPTPGDAGFEDVAQGSGSMAYTYNPTGSAWAFGGNAGLSGNNSNFTAGNPAAPEGGQVAFLQANGSIAQSVANWAAGNYTLSFAAAQRQNFASNQSILVYVDDVLVATIQPTGTTYATYTTASFAVGAGSHTIKLQGTSSSIYDTAFVDNVSVARAPASS